MADQQSQTKSPHGRHDNPRRWRIPPAWTRTPETRGPEGIAVLEEFMSELGGVLWRSVRNVRMWADVPPAEREGLFPEGAYERRMADLLSLSVDEELEGPLSEIAKLLGTPHTVDPERIGLACAGIAAWAARAEAPKTELEFLQAAGMACPHNAEFALEAGRAARDRAEYPLAESWLQRAVALGRRQGQWKSYILAYIAYGKMMTGRGVLPHARRCFTKALRRANHQGIRGLQGMALHDLFIVEYESGHWNKAQDYAAQAVAAYPKRDAGLPNLANDIAYVWMERGYFAHALPVARMMVPRIIPEKRVGAVGSVGRAAGVLGDRAGFADAVKMLDGIEAGPHLADAWLDIARGAASLKLWDQAEKAAEKAERIAGERGQGKVRLAAEEMLRSVRDRRPVEQVSEPEEAGTDVVAERLSRELVASLQAVPVFA